MFFSFIPCAIPVEAIRCSGSLFACTVALVVDAPSPRADHAFSGRIAKRRTAKRCWFLRRVLDVASVSGRVLMFQGCCIKVFSRKQECPALSSAEAELCAMTENSKCQSTSSHSTRRWFAQPMHQLRPCSNADGTLTTAQSNERAHMPRELQSRNDSQDLLFLQDYACKLSHTQLTLEATCAFFFVGARCLSAGRT